MKSVDNKRPLKVFLCHAHADRDSVRGLYARLTKDGVDAWLDKAKLLPGQDWELEIRKAVREADVVVVCLSKQFNQAGFRQKEVRLALDTAMEKPEGEIFIVPARLEECDNLESLRLWHWVDLFEDDGYEMLMRALHVRADKVGVIFQMNTIVRNTKSDFPSENPFFSGGAVPSDLFVGRTSTLALIRSRLGGKSLQSVSIVGERRMGKSSVLRYVAERAGALFSNQPVVVMLDLMRGYCQTRTGFMKALRREIQRACGHEPWSASEDTDIASLSFGVEDLYASGVRLILCLDEMEELTSRREEFDDVLEALRAAGQMGQVGLLTASAHPLGELCQSNNLLSPFFNIFMQDTLGLLSRDEWVNLISTKMQVSADELNAIQEIANGQPFYTQMAAGRLWDAKHGGADQDWVALAQCDMEPHWKSQWGHFTELEKTTIRLAVGLQQGSINSRMVENLTRRGVLVEGKPFSLAYQKWLKDVPYA